MQRRCRSPAHRSTRAGEWQRTRCCATAQATARSCCESRERYMSNKVEWMGLKHVGYDGTTAVMCLGRSSMAAATTAAASEADAAAEGKRLDQLPPATMRWAAASAAARAGVARREWM